MHLVIDANVYIFGLGIFGKKSCSFLLKCLANDPSCHKISISRTIVREVGSNLIPKDFHNFFDFLNVFTTIDEDFFIPFKLVARYESMGLKPADAFIAAYAEFVGADILVSENRHFLARHRGLPFRILNAEKCLKLI